MGEITKALTIYQNARISFPADAGLELDYARVLYQTGRYADAWPIIEAYRINQPNEVEAQIMSAYIDLWNGRMISADKKATTILNAYPQNVEALDIRRKISSYRTPYVQMAIQIGSDDQPRQSQTLALEAGRYLSNLLSPVLQFNAYQFQANSTSYHSQWIRISNTFKPAKGLKLSAGTGFFQHALTRTSSVTGGISADQSITKALSVKAEIERMPYQYTIASLLSPILYRKITLSATLNDHDKWLASAGYEQQHFDDQNNVHTLYAWGLAPLIHSKDYSIKAGYAFSYGNADQNRFTSPESLSTIIRTTPLSTVLPGIYTPYLTPQNQSVHSFLASASLQLAKNVSFSSRLNLGVAASANNPYLTLERQGNQYFILKRYAAIDYSPMSLVTSIQAKLSKKLFASLQYTYEKLFFYSYHQGSIQLKYLFLND